jgi:hypothetical protein
MASPAHHTAQEPGSSAAASAPDATRTPVPTEALMVMLSKAPTKTMAVASRKRSICRWKPTLASRVAATRGASVLPTAVAAAGRALVLIGRLTRKAASKTPGHTDLPSRRNAATAMPVGGQNGVMLSPTNASRRPSLAAA